MEDRYIRTRMVVGDAGMEKLKQAKVAIFGIGGVGSFAAEALARAGVGDLTLIDFDTVAFSNLNRQIHALESTVGQPKVTLMKARIEAINPEIRVKALEALYNEETAPALLSDDWDYVIDAIDMVTSKIHLIETCVKRRIPIVSSMGTGNKMDPTQFKLADIYETAVCPLAKVLRKELKVRGVKKLTVVYSTEQPRKPLPLEVREDNPNKQIPGSISFVPPVAGMILASKVVNDLLGNKMGISAV